MEFNTRRMHLFLGIALLTQAVTSLIGGSLFLNPLGVQSIDDAFMRMVAGSTGTAYASILMQIATAAVIILLGVAMYRLGGRISKPTADIALLMYVAEAVLLLVSQMFVYGLLHTAQLYVAGGDPSLIAVGDILYTCGKFCGEIAMIPFGIGAVLFYYLITKAGVVPKWLGWYGTITAVLVPIFVPLGTFGSEVSFVFLLPYMPFEFFAGAFIIIRSMRKRSALA